VLVVLAALMLGMLLASLNQTTVATALPTIVGELGGLNHLSWVITSFLLTSTVALPIYGKLSDLYGRKLLFELAIVIFMATSLGVGLAGNMLQLILLRGAQGVGAGGIMAMSQTIIGDIVAPRERGRYQAYMTSVFAVSSVAGPLIGGFFVDSLSWRWIFLMNLPLGALALVVTAIVLKLPYRRLKHPIDYTGATLMVAGTSCLLLVASWGGTEYEWASPVIVALGVAGVALMAGFFLQESRAREALLPLRLFRMRNFNVCSGLGFAVSLAMFGVISFLPLYLQVVKGVSPTSSGLRMLPLMGGMLTASVLSGRMISSTGRYRHFPILGTATTVAGLYLLSHLDTGTSQSTMSLYMLTVGLGMGMVMPVIVMAVQNVAEYRDLGAATAGVSFFRQMGGAFGVAIFGSILNARLGYWVPRLVPSEGLSSSGARALFSSPERMNALPTAVLEGLRHAFANSLHAVFLWAIPVALIAFGVAWLLHEHPLRAVVLAEGEAEASGATMDEATG